jgi:hypothetical protein
MRLSRIVMVVVLVGLTATVANASKVVITAPDPTCPNPNQIVNDTVTIDGTMDSNNQFVNCTGATLDTLVVDITPTLPHDSILCILLGNAFNECEVSTDSTPPPPGLTILDLVCDNTVEGLPACTGLLNTGGVGVSFSAPEPGIAESLMLGVGIPFFGIGLWKRRKESDLAGPA